MASYTIGLDLGGTAIKGGLLDASAAVQTHQSISTESESGPDGVIDRMAELAERLRAEADVHWGEVTAVGVGTPGPVNEAGVVLAAPNLPGWRNVDLRSGLAHRLNRPVTVVNDANAAAYGEYLAGAGRGETVQHMVLLTLGTGVGGGIVLGGELFTGSRAGGAELGHTIIELNGRPCGCGQRGCLEQYASATAISQSAQERMQAGQVSRLDEHPTSRQVFEAAAHGDELARQVIDEACDYLGAGCVSFTRIFDPQMIVLGGGVVAAGEDLLDRVRDRFAHHTWDLREEIVRIEPATLGNDAGFIGAAGLAAAQFAPSSA